MKTTENTRYSFLTIWSSLERGTTAFQLHSHSWSNIYVYYHQTLCEKTEIRNRRNQILKMQKQTYNERDFLISTHFITQDRLTCHWNQSINLIIVIYKALSFDVAQGRMNGAPNETRTHSCRFASLAC